MDPVRGVIGVESTPEDAKIIPTLRSAATEESGRLRRFIRCLVAQWPAGTLSTLESRRTRTCSRYPGDQ